jgi:hypothetical protein
MIEHDYVTIKLINGDTVICVLISDEEDSMTIMYPICMKPVRVEVENKAKEVMVGSPWCSFTDDPIFEIYKQDVIIIKPLNQSTIEYYKNMVDMTQFEEDYEEQLSETYDNLQIEYINELPEEFFFVPGNKTVN